MIYFCSQKNRRALVLAKAGLNGIDYLEVVGPPGCGTQLAVTFLKDARTLGLTPANIALSGGAPVEVTSLAPPTDEDPLLLTIELSTTGDFSKYTLSLVAEAGVVDPPDGLDPVLSTVEFSFKAGCPTPADCLPNDCCPAPAAAPPNINYLAKDFNGFRQAMLDRMAVLTPSWTETHVADLGVTLVEALSYVADHLSYQQDAVSTEAYIGTARSRISLRRHGRLVDYDIGEGCNARTWVYVEVAPGAPVTHVPQGTPFFVRTPGFPTVIPATNPPDPRALALQKSPQPIFAALASATITPAHNSFDFYTWQDANCCLPGGATQATLAGHHPGLKPGMVLIFEEILGPDTGVAEDADPTHRWAVRLTGATAHDYKQRPLKDPVSGDLVTRIEWSGADALPFPLCVSATPPPSTLPLNVSVARGNIIPADHGSWVVGESLGCVPPPPPAPIVAASCDCAAASSSATSPRSRYYPQLARSPLTFGAAYDRTSPASALATSGPSTATAQISVTSDDGTTWTVVEDLLSSTSEEARFVPEIESNGAVFLRFGDDTYGRAPEKGLTFNAIYRVGNGSVGNIGRDTIAHVLFAPGVIQSVRNPLAAAGGTDPEDMDHIRQWAPFAFQTQERCVTEADYGQMAVEPGVIAQARGTLRWTGSWYTAFASVEPVGVLSAQLLKETLARLNLLRMMGTDLAVEGAVIVGLRIVMKICVAPDHFAGDVYAALMKVFIAGNQCSGQAGLLNAANFSFGETVYASPLVAAAQAVDGVVAATLVTFTRMDNPSVDGVAAGYITLGRLEIPRCDNDPNHLDRGVFQLQTEGGK